METNLKRMAKAIKHVKTGEITYAIRKSQYNGFVIAEGDVLGMWDGDIAVVGKDPFDVLERLLEKMVGPSDEVVTVFYGCGLARDEVLARTASLVDRFAQCEIEVREGGQPLYYFIVSVE
jgi:dihydroxyacetone kinase-like predicted kinase